MSNQREKLEALMQDYFDGLYHCDVALLTLVFHPRALYATADEPVPLFRHMDEYFDVVSKRISPASRAEERKDFIDHIEIAGDNTALAKVRCSIGDRDFVDYSPFLTKVFYP
ncbi:nuclear transport factor 2 family protein [Pseudemcibacter aquimaris]|uniref:nuclear transport factor 2 family protein n=1 Tax=Pseudemcibacter aquimaris TaxID=2857064 RepID=UPI002011FAF4|nr:nuclear transport factor 2 family protein [Pseudemcibacter aquimaris]MCC3861191.1 nuclear transport factor 2 family protein [Pseudemcibacter aquimaris]WDU57966.1 nuclear transport factor 2 family protein [Pseudemcibacter aquimaris]